MKDVASPEGPSGLDRGQVHEVVAVDGRVPGKDVLVTERNVDVRADWQKPSDAMCAVGDQAVHQDSVNGQG